MKSKSTSARKPAGGSKPRKAKAHFPTGWNQARVQSVLDHYEPMTAEERLADIKNARAAAGVDKNGVGYTLMSVPDALVSKVTKLIARHEGRD